MLRATPILLLAALLPGCAWLFPESGSETESPGLEVVDDQGAFDPSEAVDDEAAVGPDALGASPTTGSAAEDIASEAEVEQREERRAAAAREADGKGQAAEAAPANNPEFGPAGKAEPWWSTAIDWIAEALVVALAALLITLLLRFAVGIVTAFVRAIRHVRSAVAS